MAEAWEPFVAAAFAPVVVWLLWRLQIYSVEVLRWRLVKLVRWGGTKWLYSVVSWFGVFLHEVSHACVLLLSGHGVKEFRAGVEQGHVLPGKMRKGPVAFLSFLVAALAPLFIPPILVLVGLYFLVSNHVLAFQVGGTGLQGATDVLRREFVDFPVALGRAVAGLDLAQWPHAIVFGLVLLGMPASRPSHVKGSRYHGTKDEGDVAVLRERIRHNPLVFIVFLLLLYGSYFLTTLTPQASAPYWFAFEAVWAVALTGIALALFGAVWWTLTALTAQTKALLAWLGPVTFIACEVLLRWPASGGFGPIQINAIAIGAWAIVACALAVVVPRRRGLL